MSFYRAPQPHGLNKGGPFRGQGLTPEGKINGFIITVNNKITLNQRDLKKVGLFTPSQTRTIKFPVINRKVRDRDAYWMEKLLDMKPEGSSRQTERIFLSFKATKCETRLTKNRLCQLFLWYFMSSAPQTKKSLSQRCFLSEHAPRNIYDKESEIYIYIHLYLSICPSL